MRSKLFVPGARPELFAKACASAADAISFDLEDSVPAGSKAAARAQVAGFLAARAHDDRAKLVIVRTNAPDSSHFDADLEACLDARADLVNLPKVESASALRDAVARLQALESRRGLARTAGLLVNIESPRALRNAAAIAAADPRVAGLQVGLGDLFEAAGIARSAANVHAVLFQVRMAAAENGAFACDGAYPAIADEAGFRAEARLAHELGYVGKSCIHPRQIAWCHDVFTIAPAEIEHARRVVAAARHAAGAGHAAFQVDGRMIDPPFLRRAQALLAAAGDPAA